MDRRRAARLAPVVCVCVVALAGCATRTGAASPAPGGASSQPAPAPPATTPAPAPSPRAVTQVFIVPDLVGDALVAARDTLQSLGSYSLDPQDASGSGRPVTVDSSWQVCTQSPLPGEVVEARTVVILASVTAGDSCP